MSADECGITKSQFIAERNNVERVFALISLSRNEQGEGQRWKRKF